MNKVCALSNPCSVQPSVVTVETTEGINRLANCFVYVTSINTVYFVNSCHEITLIASGPVFVDLYDPTTNPLELRNQVCYDFAANQAYVFNARGEYRTITMKGANL